jgi:hypothetical protein
MSEASFGVAGIRLRVSRGSATADEFYAHSSSHGNIIIPSSGFFPSLVAMLHVTQIDPLKLRGSWITGHGLQAEHRARIVYGSGFKAPASAGATFRKREMESSMEMTPAQIRKTRRFVKSWGSGEAGGWLFG